MSFPKFKADSICVGGKDRSIQKTFMVIYLWSSKVLIGYFSFSSRYKSMTVDDNTIQAESLGDFF